MFPERIMPNIKINITKKIIKYLIIFFLTLKTIGKKMANKENLCIYHPAINSSPKGPESFLVVTGEIPNISLPKEN